MKIASTKLTPTCTLGNELLKFSILLSDPNCHDIVREVGAPVIFLPSSKSQKLRYNCRILLLNGRILLIRPKILLADRGLHRESKWFFP